MRSTNKSSIYRLLEETLAPYTQWPAWFVPKHFMRAEIRAAETAFCIGPIAAKSITVARILKVLMAKMPNLNWQVKMGSVGQHVYLANERRRIRSSRTLSQRSGNRVKKVIVLKK